MHADDYAGFRELYRKGDVREVACLAHVRRKFVDVHRSQGSAIAEERVRLRQSDARPVLDGLEAWLAAQPPALSAKTPLATAIRHALIRLPKLKPYLKHGTLDADNNAAERALRGVALGRRNHLFVGPIAGGRRVVPHRVV